MNTQVTAILSHTDESSLLDLTHEQLDHGSIEWIGLSKMQLYSKSLFFELDTWNFGSIMVFVSINTDL